MTTTTDTKMAWERVADRLDGLGLKLKVHLEEAGPASEVSDALARLGSAIEGTFSVIGASVQDPAIREDAKNLAVALGDALADTLSHEGEVLADAADGLRCRGASTKGEPPKRATDE